MNDFTPPRAALVLASAALAALALVAGCGPGTMAFDAGTLPPPDPSPLPCPAVGITGASPGSGTVGIDHTITIMGGGFNNGATVDFIYRPPGGGMVVVIPGVNTSVLSPSQIRSTLPMPSPGNYDVRVTRGGADDCVDDHTLRDAFRAAPVSSGLFTDCTAANIPSFGMLLNGRDPIRVVSADFDCDGDADAVVGVKPGDNIFLEGVPDSNGDGITNFVLRTDVFVGGGRLEELLAVDLDGDGDKDLLYADSSEPSDDGGVHLFRNQGNCSGALSFSDVTATTLPTARAGMADVTTGDVNGDGLLDIAAVSTTFGEGLVLIQNTAGTFSNLSLGLPPQSLASGGTVDVVIFDREGDGFGDIANGGANSGAGTDGTSVGILLHNDGGTSLTDWTTNCGLDAGVSPELKGTTYFIGAGDLDLDGFPDLVWSSSAASFVLLNQAGTLTPSECGFTRIPTPFGGSSSRMTLLVDIDTDGDLDVWDGSSIFLENNGAGALASTWPNPVMGGAGVVNYGIATPDLDGDGILDVLVSQNQAPSLLCATQDP